MNTSISIYQKPIKEQCICTIKIKSHVLFCHCWNRLNTIDPLYSYPDFIKIRYRLVDTFIIPLFYLCIKTTCHKYILKNSDYVRIKYLQLTFKTKCHKYFLLFVSWISLKTIKQNNNVSSLIPCLVHLFCDSLSLCQVLPHSERLWLWYVLPCYAPCFYRKSYCRHAKCRSPRVIPSHNELNEVRKNINSFDLEPMGKKSGFS